MNVKEIGHEDVDRTVAQDRVQRRGYVNTVMNLRVTKSGGNFFTSWATLSVSRRTLFNGVC